MSAKKPDIPVLAGRKKFRRKVSGIAAALLPFEPGGRIAVPAFQNHLIATHAAGLVNAVNMDTGYVNSLSMENRKDVLKWAREALGRGITFVAGVYIEGSSGDIVTLYRQQIDTILSYAARPILFQTSRLAGQSGMALAETYQAICRGYENILVFELSPKFAANGEILSHESFLGLMDIPEITGMKHSSLDRVIELERLALRDQHRPDFRIYTGNDLGIDMIEYGSDYLLGLATFAPEKFAERDRLWEAGESSYYALSDALQYLGNVAFREPIPAYKHSAAVFLHLMGRIPSPRTHPQSPNRPVWESEILSDCARRLDLLH